MAIEVKSKVINNQQWQVRLFSTEKGLPLWFKLLDVVGESFTGFFASETEAQAYNQAMTAFLKNIHKQDMQVLIKELLENVTLDGEDILPKYNTEFAGNYGVLFQVVWFVVFENYKSFLEVIGVTKAQ